VILGATRRTVEVVRAMAAAMEEHRAHLTKLDSEIGDGDHGTNMHRGFQAALERLETAEPATPADVLKAVSMALIGKVGGGFAGRTRRREAAGQGRGGDKTMIDALTPAAEAATNAGGSLAEVFRAAADAAKGGAESTVEMTARRGRASYLGARAVGHMDPGAHSSYLLLDAAARTLESA
jgi:dihydroxyacetone kinase-like protein